MTAPAVGRGRSEKDVHGATRRGGARSAGHEFVVHRCDRTERRRVAFAPRIVMDGCRDPAQFVMIWLTRFRVTGEHLLRRVFINVVGLGFEEGSFPSRLLRLFLHRVTGQDYTHGAVEEGDGRHSQQRPRNAGDDAAR